MTKEIRYVEWTDSMGSSGWESLRGMRDMVPDSCKSVGFVLEETDDYVLLLQSFTNRKSADDDCGDNCIVIPKFAITATHTLVPAGPRGESRQVDTLRGQSMTVPADNYTGDWIH